jgi:hypothetical protein
MTRNTNAQVDIIKMDLTGWTGLFWFGTGTGTDGGML